MKSFQPFIVVLTFFGSVCDCYTQLLPWLAGWPEHLMYVGKFGLLVVSVMAGAFVAHALMSVLQDISILDGLVQEEPTEEEVCY